VKRVSKLLCAVICFFVFAVTSASAETTHKFLFSLNGGATPDRSFHPEGVYFDESVGLNAGDMYVNDGAHQLVDRLSSDGVYECQITGAGSATVSPSECDSSSLGVPSGSLAGFLQEGTVDSATGNVYVGAGNATDIFNPAGAYVSEIQDRGAVAFSDSTGHLLIGRSHGIDEYDPATSTLSEFAMGTPGGQFEHITDIAVDNDPSSPSYGDVYVSEEKHAVVDVFDSSGLFLKSLAGAPGKPFLRPERLAIDSASGELYVWDKDTHSAIQTDTLYQFAATGAIMGQRALIGFPQDIAVNGTTGNLYVANLQTDAIDVYGADEIIPNVTTGGASNVGPKGATLEGTINPDGVEVDDCHFDYGTTTSYGQVAPCVPGADSIGADSSDHAVDANLTGLLNPGTSYHFRLEGTNVNGPNYGQDMTFSTTPPPSITGATAANVTASSADLKAQINPNGHDTTYRIEWGASIAYGNNTPVPDADIGEGIGNISISHHVIGLTAGTTYHWRVVATNLADTTTGLDHTFIYDTSPPTLPDNRAYELVTPVQKNGSQFDAGLILPLPIVAQDGDRVMMATIQCFVGATSCTATREPEGSLWSLDRTAGGWQATPASPPATQFTASSIKAGAFDADTGTALFSSTGASGGKDQLVSRAPDGSFAVIGPVQPPSATGAGPAPVALTSSDLLHVVFQGHSENLDWPFDTSLQGGFHTSLFEYEGAGNSEPFLVGVSGGRGSNDLVSKCSTEVSALSTDGRVVIFSAAGHLSDGCLPSATAPDVDEVLARIDESETVLLSGRSPGDCTSPSCQSSAPKNAQFRWASEDGSKVLFTSAQQLTDTATQGSKNLYLYDFGQPAGHELVDISAGGTGGASPDVKGAAFSADGSHAYFVAASVLGGGLDAKGQPPIEGGSNLYSYERDAAYPGGELSFVATLPESDGIYWSEIRTAANVTPDGRFLVFLSHGKLTPDDTSESGAAQIFRYDAQNDELLRISIGEGGFNDNGNAGGASLCVNQSHICSADASLATEVSTRRDPTMSHDGAYVFFQSPAALTPQAMHFSPRPGDGASYGQNVYEYHAGHVYLISDGRDASAGSGQGVLIGTDASGSNVFFKTFAGLVRGDTDGGQLDIYDARVGGGFTVPSPPVICQGDACRAAATQAPVSQTAASSTFSGPGNATPRQPHRKKKKKHPHKKHRQHKRSASNSGRTNR
jgi:hypothetical protein